MKFLFIFLLILLLTGCVPALSAATATGTSTPTAVPTATATPEPTPTLSPVEPLLEAYLAGQSVDISKLSPAEYKEFSIKLAEKKNAERGINPIVYNNEAYINPDNLMMMDYDGHADMAETITMYLAIAGEDAEGNIQIIDEKGKTITITNSANMDWNMRVTDMNDPRIDLANTGPTMEKYGGLTVSQRVVSSGTEVNSFTPIVLLNKNPGLIYFEGNSGGMREFPTYQFLKIVTDQNGNPLFARKTLIFPATGVLYRFTEGLDDKSLYDSLSGQKLSNSSFHGGLSANYVYFILIRGNQKKIYEEYIFSHPSNYTGVIDGNEAPSVLTGKLENNTDMILLGTDIFIKPAN